MNDHADIYAAETAALEPTGEPACDDAPFENTEEP